MTAYADYLYGYAQKRTRPGAVQGPGPEHVCFDHSKAPGQQLIENLAYHDPENNWPQLKSCLYLSSADTAGNENRFEIEMDNSTGYFAHISHQDGKEVVKGIDADGKEFYLLDGKQEISTED